MQQDKWPRENAAFAGGIGEYLIFPKVIGEVYISAVVGVIANGVRNVGKDLFVPFFYCFQCLLFAILLEKIRVCFDLNERKPTIIKHSVHP